MSSNIDFDSVGVRSSERIGYDSMLSCAPQAPVRADDLLKVDSIEHMISQPEFGAMQVFTGAQDKGFTHL